MPDTDPVGEMRIRSVPQSVRRTLHAQAVARGLTMAQWLAQLVNQSAVAEQQEEAK